MVTTSASDQDDQIAASYLNLAGKVQEVDPGIIAETDDQSDDPAQHELPVTDGSEDQPSDQSTAEPPPAEVSAASLAALQSQIDPGRVSDQATQSGTISVRSTSVVVPQGETTSSLAQSADDGGHPVAQPMLGNTSQEGDSLGGEAQADSGGSPAVQTVSAKSSPLVHPGHVDFSSHLDLATNLSSSPSVRSDQQVAATNDVAPAPAPPPDSNEANISRVIRGMRGVIHQNGGAVTLRLSPPEMGIVRVEMQIHQGTVNAQLHTEQEGARALLTQQLGQLRQSLEAHGLQVDRLSVATLPSDGTSFTTDRDAEQSSADGRSRGHNLASNHEGKGEREQDGQDSDARQTNLEFEEALNMVV